MPDAINTLANTMRDEDVAAAARVAAANAILDRGYVKAPQHVTGDVETR